MDVDRVMLMMMMLVLMVMGVNFSARAEKALKSLNGYHSRGGSAAATFPATDYHQVRVKVGVTGDR